MKKSSGKHSWSYDENKYCCEKYFNYFVINKFEISASNFINELCLEMPDISYGSMRMKVQNIKQILFEKGIKDSLKIKPLCNYSTDNFKALENVLIEYNFKIV